MHDEDHLTTSPEEVEYRQQWTQLRARIASACARAGRDPQEVQVVAVTKNVPAAKVAMALRGGWQHFGENRAQELKAKQHDLGDFSGTWHFIGQLQTNKVRDVVGQVAYIHSLDRESLAVALQRQAERLSLCPVSCFLEVNVAQEGSKAGIVPDQATKFVQSFHRFPNLQLVGLMTIAPLMNDPEEARPVFRQLAQLRDHLQQQGYPYAPLQHLSMGMSADFEVALEEGADYIRLGTLIFGSR